MRACIFSFFFFLATIVYGQDTSILGVKELMVISDHYKEISSLQIDIRYKAYGDTLQKNLLDSSTEKFVSYNRHTFTSHLNTVSIVADSLVFFMDHTKKIAYLDRKPILNSGSEEIQKRMQSFISQGKGYRRIDLGAGKIKYRILSDGILYDWIDVYIHMKSNELNRIVYKFSEDTKRKGVSLMVIDFTNQRTGKSVDPALFSLEKYLTFKESTQGTLLPAYSAYKFYSYVY